eukprot:11173720-Lingulodinium_polyedra.AAC.1
MQSGAKPRGVNQTERSGGSDRLPSPLSLRKNFEAPTIPPRHSTASNICRASNRVLPGTPD